MGLDDELRERESDAARRSVELERRLAALGTEAEAIVRDFIRICGERGIEAVDFADGSGRGWIVYADGSPTQISTTGLVKGYGPACTARQYVERSASWAVPEIELKDLKDALLQRLQKKW